VGLSWKGYDSLGKPDARFVIDRILENALKI
jgi:hypothetical protein